MARVDSPALNLRAAHAGLTEKTYHALRDLIVSRSLAAGAKMSAETLARRFGVSRTTVKDAINQLASEGLVVVRPQAGTFVRGLTQRDVHEIWDTRIMIETHAGRRGILSASAEQRRELREVADSMVPLVEGREYDPASYERFVALDRRLHELVVETADNVFLLGLFKQVNVYVHIVNFHSRRGLRRADQGLKEHQAIASAYERADGSLLEATITQHIERSRDVVLNSMTQPDVEL